LTQSAASRHVTAPAVAPVSNGRHRRGVAVLLAAVVGVLGFSPGVAAARPAQHPPDAIVASVTVPSLAVFASPGAAAPSETLPNPNKYGGHLVVLVEAVRADGWLDVLLPVRPNGTTGWIHGGDVILANDPYRILVDLHEHRIVVTDRSQVVLRDVIAVGKPNTPTPGGGYYLTQLFKTPDPSGAYGPYAYSLSGYSEVLTTFDGGDAIIGLHGTNRPDLLGQDVSSGCIRLRNDAITKLAQLLPLGTPVTIVA
jgi:lipoprotein-anchoring transpeptidase ErfK/SrfK